MSWKKKNVVVVNVDKSSYLLFYAAMRSADERKIHIRCDYDE